MVSQATVQAHVNYGLAKIAEMLGAPCQWYRASSPNGPTDYANYLGPLQVLLDTNADMQQRRPRRRDKPEEWYGAFDQSQVAVGDYFVDQIEGTLFVIALDPFRPARMALCNRVLTIMRPGRPTPGDDYYGGLVLSGPTLMSGWPAVVAQGTKGEMGEAHLPGDTRLPWVAILLPDCGVEIRTGDIAIDDQTIPARYSISGTERTAEGWRLSAALATP